MSAPTDSRGKELKAGDKVRLYDRNLNAEITVEIEDLDSRQDKPGNPAVIIYTAPGETRNEGGSWAYTDETTYSYLDNLS